MKQTETPECKCPFCDKKLNATTDVLESNVPEPGDFTICISCAQVLVFDEALKPRKPTEKEYEIAARVPAVKALQKAIKFAVTRSAVC